MPVLSLRASPNALPQQRCGAQVADLGAGQVHLNLEVGGLWEAQGDQRWRVIIRRRGLVWITQVRDVVDYLLHEGEMFVVTQRGTVLVQALKAASVTITPSLRATPHAEVYRTFG